MYYIDPMPVIDMPEAEMVDQHLPPSAEDEVQRGFVLLRCDTEFSVWAAEVIIIDGEPWVIVGDRSAETFDNVQDARAHFRNRAGVM